MWLAVEGIIGAGKTTTAELLGERTHLSPLIERSDQHPLLNAYYSDPNRYGLETELVFMALQAHQVAASEDSAGFISDFAPAKNFVFARVACNQDDLVLLGKVDARLWRDLPKPDLVIVLDVPPPVCLQRIFRRGRAYEQDLTIANLERLRDGYMKALHEFGADIELLDLSGDETPADVARQVATTGGLTFSGA